MSPNWRGELFGTHCSRIEAAFVSVTKYTYMLLTSTTTNIRIDSFETPKADHKHNLYLSIPNLKSPVLGAQRKSA